MKTSASQSAVIMESTYNEPFVAYVRDQGLRARFRRLRILSGILVVTVVFVAGMLVLRGDGVTLETFRDQDKSNEDVKQLVDRYNSISGSVGSFVSKPVEMFLALLMSVVFLTFATDFTLSQTSTGHGQYLPVLAAAAIAYLFSNGLNALNVQVVPGKVTARIAANDLSIEGDIQDDQPLFENRSLLTSWSRGYLENASGNSVLNTILRTKLAPVSNVASDCNGTGYDDIIRPLVAVPTIGFGFTSRSWQQEVLSTAPVPKKTLKIPLTLKVSSALPPVSALPSPMNVTANLLRIGLQVLDDLKLRSMLGVKFPTPPASTFMNETLSRWGEAVFSIENVTAGSASVEYSRFQLADRVTFDAATLEFAVEKLQFDIYEDLKAKKDGFNEMVLEDYCSREGCLIPPTVVHQYTTPTTVQARVQVTSICVGADGVTEDETNVVPPCARAANTAMRVVSIGTRIEGDLWDRSTRPDGSAVMRFKNLRTVYSITVGRLAWETENLAQAFGAECADDSDECSGLRVEMQPSRSSSDYLVVGSSKLPIQEVNAYSSSGALKWIYLVSGADGLGERRYDVISARHFSSVTANGSALRETTKKKCNTFADDYIRSVEKNHLYMEYSLQPSYTAAFYYLFQNAVPVRRQRANATSATSLATGGDDVQMLAFAGNLQIMNVQMSVPTTNVVVSLVGCALLLAIGAGIVVLAGASERQMQARASAGLVAEAMMNTAKYPPALLELALEQVVDNGNPSDERVRCLLEELRVESVVLEHAEAKNRVFHVGGNA